MPLINCEIKLILTWSINCVISEGDRVTTCAITQTKLYVPVVTLSTQDNTKLLQQLKSGFKRGINWNKYQLKVTIQSLNQYLVYLIDPSFQGVNRIFALSFQNNADQKRHTGYILPKVEIKHCNVIIDGQNFFVQLQLKII